MFRAVSLPIIRSYPLYIWHWHMLYGFDDSLHAGSGWNILILHVSCKLPETCWISYQNKFGN